METFVDEIPTTLYRFFDAAGRLLYAGVTSVGPNRWIDHERNRAWWAETVRTTVEHFPSRALALAAELEAIRTERPAYNIAGTRPPTAVRRPTRRAPGTGALSLRQDGRYIVRLITDGRMRDYYFRTEDEAVFFLSIANARRFPPETVRKALDLLEASSGQAARRTGRAAGG